MPNYRLYCLDGAGKITHAEEIGAESDEAAIAAGTALGKPVACELWHRDRLIARIAPADPTRKPNL